jgi:hypothetical protein
MFGVVLFEVATRGAEPWSGMLPLQAARRVMEGHTLADSLPRDVEPRLRALMAACWRFDSAARPSMQRVCAELQALARLLPGDERGSEVGVTGMPTSATAWPAALDEYDARALIPPASELPPELHASHYAPALGPARSVGGGGEARVEALLVVLAALAGHVAACVMPPGVTGEGLSLQDAASIASAPPPLEVSCAGLASGNPGAAACAAAVGVTAAAYGWRALLLPSATSNEADYAGVLSALLLAHEMRATRVILRTDSGLVAGQLSGEVAVRAATLKPLYAVCTDSMQRFSGGVEVRVVARSEVALVSSRARAALDAAGPRVME